jgi:hypothetical protein
MKRMRELTLILFAGLGFLPGGCAMNRVDLIETGQGRVETINPSRQDIPLPDIWLDDGAMIVYGNWDERGGATHALSPGHMHLVLRSSDGSILDRREARVTATQTGSRSLRRSIFSYRAEYPTAPPAGFLLQVQHCHEAHPGTSNS